MSEFNFVRAFKMHWLVLGWLTFAKTIVAKWQWMLLLWLCVVLWAWRYGRWNHSNWSKRQQTQTVRPQMQYATLQHTYSLMCWPKRSVVAVVAAVAATAVHRCNLPSNRMDISRWPPWTTTPNIEAYTDIRCHTHKLQSPGIFHTWWWWWWVCVWYAMHEHKKEQTLHIQTSALVIWWKSYIFCCMQFRWSSDQWTGKINYFHTRKKGKSSSGSNYNWRAKKKNTPDESDMNEKETAAEAQTKFGVLYIYI